MTEYFATTPNGSCEGWIRELPQVGPERGEAREAQLEGQYDPTMDAWLSTISVLPSARQKTGEGKKLITDFEQACTDYGCRRIIGCFEPSNDVDWDYMIAWYKKRGYYFIESKRVPEHYYVIKELV